MSDSASGSAAPVFLDATADRGYARTSAAQAQFEQAASSLLASDGWTDGGSQAPKLVADLALEGGGVKGIALVGAVLVLDEAGYSFRGVAGTSAGAIAASLIASITAAGQKMTTLKGFMDGLQFSNFMPEGKVHHFLDRFGGKVGEAGADIAILAERTGLYDGAYLGKWLRPILENDLGIRSFGDLKLPDDPNASLPPGQDYRLVVHTSDITRGELVRLPWDYPFYGVSPDSQDVVGAVRASMSIPFFFEPVRFEAQPATVSIPGPGREPIQLQYAGGTVSWVDGGMLRNFPITAFDRIDGNPPRWPTIGIKLSSMTRQFGPTEAVAHSWDEAKHALRTMMNEWDTYAVELATAGRTIFVDSMGLTATDFNLTDDQKNHLFLNGVAAANNFIFEMAQAGGVPRTAATARQYAISRSRVARAGPA
ncbi:MAG: patatin-like phospholipase family protein [Acidimicrobiales bacterium]